MVDNGLIIHILLPISEKALVDAESLISFIDDFPCWNNEPIVKFFIEKKQ